MITRYEGTDKVAEISISNSDYEQIATDKATEVTNSILDSGGYVRLIHKGTNNFPKLDLSGNKTYQYLIKGTSTIKGGSATSIDLSSRTNSTLYWRRLEQANWLTGDTATKELFHGISPGLGDATYTFFVWGIVGSTANSSTALFNWLAIGTGAGWQEVGTSEFQITDYTIPAGTLSIHAYSSGQTGTITSTQVWQLSQSTFDKIVVNMTTILYNRNGGII